MQQITAAASYNPEVTQEISFQPLVVSWLHQVLPEALILDQTERHYRFIEEAIELVQAGGLTKEDVLKMVDYVFDRPAGEIPQEIGGVMLTLAGLCHAHGRQLMTDANAELMRVHQVIDKVREKNRTKPRRDVEQR